MTTQNFKTAEIQGFSPAVDPTQSDKFFALNGRNYVFDSRGPRSVFGNRLLLPQALGRPSYTQGFRVKLRGGDRCFTITSDAILEWNETAGGWDVIYVTPNTTLSSYRWTWGYLNEKIYFCHPRTGILVYDVDTEVCVPHDGPGLPEGALAITINQGFLCVMTPVYFANSAPNDGMDFTPELSGATFQEINDRVPGHPIMITSYTGGCLIWTTGGVMRSEFTGDSAVYRHRALGTEYRPVNSFCTCRIDDDSTVILDERGLFQSKGEQLTAFAPLFNEFLGPYIQDNRLQVGNNLRLEWDDRTRLMYVSTSLSRTNPLYEQSFVLYSNLDKWGQFNESHYGIIPIQIDASSRANSFFGFVDGSGCVRYWEGTGSREATPGVAKLSANLYYPPIQKPLSYEEGADGTILSSSGVANTFNDAAISQPAAYYPQDGTSPLAPERTGLDATVVYGLFRPNGEAAGDEMSEIVSLIVRNVEGDNTIVGTAFNVTPAASIDSADLNTFSPAPNLSFGEEFNYVNHRLRVIGTVDGQTEFNSVEPSLAGVVRGARYYSCQVVGVWHMIEFRAVEVGESFHPLTMEITATSAGRLM